MKKSLLKVHTVWVLLFLVVFSGSVWAQVPVVSLTVDDGTAAEAGQESASFTVTRTNTGNMSAALATRVVVDTSQSATLFTDYSGSGWTFIQNPNIFRVTIPSGQLSAQVVLTPNQDNLIEGEETLAVSLEADGGTYTVGADYQAAFTIADDPVEVSLTLDDGDAAEAGQDPGTFTVTRTNTGKVNASLATRVVVDTSQSATLFTDYSGVGWTFIQNPNIFRVTIPSGQLSAQVVLTPIQDNLIEGEETFAVSLEAEAGIYTVGADYLAAFTIADDPVEVSLTLDDGDADEAGQDPGSFTVSRTNTGKVSAALATRVVVDTSQSATLFTDYTGQGWTFIQNPNIFQVTILPGQLSAEVSLQPVQDNLIEGTETFAVALETDGTTYTLGANTDAAFTVTDDPVIVSMTLDDGDAAEIDQDPGSFTVSRSNSGDLFSTLTTVVEVDLSQSATLFTDYTGDGWAFVRNPNIFQVYIPSNELSKTVIITPVFDLDEDEGNETLSVRLVENGDTYALGADDNIFITIENLINRVFGDSFEQ